MPAHGQVQEPLREMRGVWIATVANIDWPSRSGLSSEKQQQEFAAILDFHKSQGINAVFVQVRPAADAFYSSTREPWSRWLNGLGRAPQPYYDPLTFMVHEAHLRGMSFHAWLNPYRALTNVTDTTKIPAASIARRHPDWFVKYGNTLYFNPGIQSCQEHVVNVVMDLVRRYKIDGIHFDDYFYPYKIYKVNFPDSSTFAQYPRGFTNVDDWRRNNVDVLIKRISDSIRSVKPYIEFGVSPFSVWRNRDKDPRGSETQGMQTCYDDLYADIRKWLENGWIDYVAPQLYLPTVHAKIPYEKALSWWSQNSFGKPVYIGQAAYRVNSADSVWKDPSQIFTQMRLNEKYSNVQGSIFFSSRSLRGNALGISDSLRTRQYRIPAMVPMHASTRQQRVRVECPLYFIGGKELRIYWKHITTDSLNNATPFVLYRKALSGKDQKEYKPIAIIPYSGVSPAGNIYSFTDKTARVRKKYIYVLASVDPYKRLVLSQTAYPVINKKKQWRTLPGIGM
jgi:uncharacterized lipoprotein YddW (UPF0748 family)